MHEAWIRLSSEDDARWSDRVHFFNVAAQVMRRVLVDHARRKRAGKRGGGQQRITLVTDLTPPLEDAASDLDVLAVDEALQRLAELDAGQAKVVELRFFAGLTVDEVAQTTGVSPRTVASQWRLARAWLSKALAESDTG